ncbi:MAG: 3'(2'),5'-bisphosphate nucleotidase CysQ [Marinifilaceae bacterium]|nr:3'(2'),5'-bisphosphate nucleotidase CysQ [Marinifilaceae bacterium]
MNNILEIAVKAALSAGEEILKIYNNPTEDFGIERKSDNSPLTKADKASHKIIMEALNPTNIPILSEEGAKIPYSERKGWCKLWIVDPLDGTKEFIKKNGEFTVNIALVENNTPIAGVIYVPVLETLYWGAVGYGAYKLQRVNIENYTDLQTSLEKATKLPVQKEELPFVIVASRSHMSPETAEYIDQLRRMYPAIGMTSVGSSIKICLVGEGSADIYPRFAPTMEWDTAAGHAIVKAAGKEVYQRDEKTPLTYNKENLLNPWFIVK